MNEVRVSVNTSQVLAGTAASKGALQAQLDNNGNKLPESTEENKGLTDAIKTAKAKEAVAGEGLEFAVADMNNFVQSIQRNLQFTVDEELERTIIKVIDSHSGEVIRQIPDELFLELARKLKEDGELRLVNALG